MVIDVLTSSSQGNCYKVAQDDSSFLIEVGLPLQKIKKKLGYTLSKIDFALCSHIHFDHSKAAADILKNGIPLITSESTAAALKLNSHNLITFPDDNAKPIKIGSWQIVPFKLLHDVDVPCHGFLCQSLVVNETVFYASDTKILPPLSDRTAKSITHMIVEANHSKVLVQQNVLEGKLDKSLGIRIMRSHMAIETLVEWLESHRFDNLQEIVLCHLSDKNSCAETIKKTIMATMGVLVRVA